MPYIDVDMGQIELHLCDEDRIAIDAIRSKGVHHLREVNRAHTLSRLDRNIPESQIKKTTGSGTHCRVSHPGCEFAGWRRDSHMGLGTPMTPHAPAKEDYEYTRHGGRATCLLRSNPRQGKARQRIVRVTKRRTKVDFVAFMDELLTGAYSKARRIDLALDNLDTHFRQCFEDVLGKNPPARLLRRVVFHYTPKHASWLNMAEIEISILSRQCLDRRIQNRDLFERAVSA
jgi:hypothetical protein